MSDDPARHRPPSTELPKRQPLPRRFYKTAAVEARGDDYAVLLDGRRARTPGRKVLAVRDAAIAEALAAEWNAQGEHIDPQTMPLTRIVNSALDGVAGAMTEVQAEIVRYAGSDLVCYRAEGPGRLVERQGEVWDPVIRWAHEQLGARFMLAEGIIHVAQTPEALAAVRGAIAGYDPLRLAALSVATTLTGSALLALAVAHRALSAEEAWNAAQVDEDWQRSQWGDDPEALRQRAARWRDMAAAALILSR